MMLSRITSFERQIFNQGSCMLDKTRIHTALCSRSITRHLNHTQKKKHENLEDVTQSELFEEENQDKHDYQNLVNRMQLLPSGGHQVFIIQPYVKWGPKKNLLTTPDLMLEEAKALVDSLPNWKYVDAIKIPSETLEKKQVFGSGQFESLQQRVVRNPNISAVFVSLNILRGIQRKYIILFRFCYETQYLKIILSQRTYLSIWSPCL